MAADAAGVLHGADPIHLGQARRDAARAAELIGGGNLQHRVPVDRWVVVRRGCLARGDHCGNGNPLSGLRARLRTVYQAVTTCPDLIASRWKIGDDETAPIVGDDTLDVADR